MSSESASVPSASPAPQKKPRLFWCRLGKFFSTAALVILVLAAGYSFFRLINANSFLVQAFSQLEQQFQQQQKQMNSLQAQIKDMQSSATLLRTELDTQTQTINEWRSRQQNPQMSWTVLEAQYLAKIANDNVMFNHNIPAAVAALKSADELLRTLPDPQVEPIRRALIGDIDRLQSMPFVDTTGLYLRLAGLYQKIDHLPLNYEQIKLAPTAAPEGVAQKWWQKGVHNIGLSLRQLVQVRYNPPNTAPFILPEQKNYLYQNLHAQIQNAQWGLLAANEAIYKSGLLQAEMWIKQYFNLGASDTQYILSQLAELQKVDLQPSAATIAASLEAFHQYFTQPQGNTNQGATS